MNPLDTLRVLLIYHLNEALSGDAIFVEVCLSQDDARIVETRDDGRGMATDRMVAGRSYIDLVLGQLDLLDSSAAEPLEPAWLQLHALGLSLVARSCCVFELDVSRNGLRRRGRWQSDGGHVVWEEAQPTAEHGTRIRVTLQGYLDFDSAQALVLALSRRCPSIGLAIA